ncbi:MAG TPA: BTAD domain-containing putative transcriptional regulator [Dongiaceae bacterium]
MPSCRLTVLGGFGLAVGDGGDLVLPTRKDRLLLAYLALAGGRAQGRERLAGLLWGDRGETQARDSLRQSLAAFRQVFRQSGLDPLRADRDMVALDISEIAVDAIEFTRLAGTAPATALPLYRGELLEGFDGITAESDAWLGPERERLADLAAETLERIAGSATPITDAAAAICFGRQLLARDNLREPVARALMQLLARNGDRADALKVYGAIRANLERELRIAPDARTEALYRDIMTDRLGTASSTDGEEYARARDGIPDPAADRPAIAVLPLDNLSGDPTLDPLCEGLTEDIITGLGRFRLLFVIDRYSSAAVAKNGADLAEIGRRLGVGFLVQSSLQRQGERVRITVRLVDSAARTQLWGESFDESLTNVLVLPDRIIGAIVSTLHGRVESSLASETRRKPKLAAYECVLCGIKHLRGYGPEDNARAIALFEQAMALDPEYQLARAYRAFADVVTQGYDDTPDHVLCEASAVIAAAMEIEGDDGRFHLLLGTIHGALGDLEREAMHYRRAIELNPNDANAIAASGFSQVVLGRVAEGLERVHLAMRLNPFHPEWYWVDLGAVLYVARRYEDAIEAFAHRSQPGRYVLPRLAACLAQLGRMEEAAVAVAELRRLQPDFSVAALRLRGWRPADAEHFREGMRKAGLP